MISSSGVFIVIGIIHLKIGVFGIKSYKINNSEQYKKFIS